MHACKIIDSSQQTSCTYLGRVFGVIFMSGKKKYDPEMGIVAKGTIKIVLAMNSCNSVTVADIR